MFQEYQTVDTVEDLYNEIEHLIDVPFEKFSKDVQQYQIADNTVSGLEHIDQHYQSSPQCQEHPKQAQNASTEDASFERPILIESDSDEVEEELLTPDQQYTYITCYKCNKVLPFEPNNALSVNNVNVCLDCSTKKRGRSRSFISEVADKLKNLGSSSNSVSLLSPSTAKMDRRKSMPSMNDAYTSSSLAPSPTPSRPSSRASSFIEDVKQFLAPLSRKSSRNSMFQDYQQSENASPHHHQGPSRKTSHNSLLDAINICKPRQKSHTSPSYERRIIDENNWTQEDNEVMNIFQQQQQQGLQNTEELDVVQHIPIRRKQIKQIESRQDRIDIYNSAYLDCMQAPTDLVPWIIKQTQKGPPDDWFGYTPPATREPKKVMGIFKRKVKSRGDLRAQQLQLGDELLNRSTPLLHHRYSNSNLSVSPSANSMYMENADVVHSPSEISPQDYDENDQEYFDGYHEHPAASTAATSISPSQSAFSPMEDPLTPPTNRSQSAQPVSILKKTNSSRQLQQPDYAYDPYYQDTVPYDDIEDDDYHNFNQGAMYNNDYDYEYGYEQPSRHYAAPMHAPMRQRSSSSMVADRSRYNNSRQQMMNEQDYHISMNPIRRRRSRSRSRNEDYYYNDAPAPTYYDDTPSSYYDPVPPPHPVSSRRARDHHQSPAAMRTNSSNSRRSSLATSSSKKAQDYYGLSAKLTPFMMEEWEITLDELCDLFPRLDRHYINDFLRSAQGDFVTAKNMIMEMIMELR
ncbi:hypothetical protein HMPREF1544_03757 [Mucor circinelloides 1006PhL]|uniref:CUE domain-containing protein n=1 Tax=Mucor circinelloides f. circinelloides (strain 1006PhL) TaxID=1220926 RepID=S2K2G5_MUCC1|nr:hypothetical protein HMPREF1544_03757 [Mucor circinelloides 1006PhL]